MRRTMLLGVLGLGILGWWGGAARGAEAAGEKPQGAKDDPVDVAVEKILSLPPGLQLTADQQAGIEKVRDHYRPLLRDAVIKAKGGGRNVRSQRQAEEDLASLKAQAIAEGQNVLNTGSAGNSQTEDVNSSVVGPAGVIVVPGNLGIRIHLHQPMQPHPPITGHFLGDKPTGPAKPGGSAPTTIQTPSRPVVPTRPVMPIVPSTNTTTTNKKPGSR